MWHDKSMTERVLIFDTTLRDGEQSPGVSLNTAEKLEIAHQLARLGVDVIEAGFPVTSPGEMKAVREIAQQIEGSIICALARTSKEDIEAAWKSIRDAERARIHTFIATSDIHIKSKLQTTRNDVIGQTRAAVAHARSLCDDVEFSPEDASRSDIEFMAEVISVALEEGATTINCPDTVGYMRPSSYAAMFKKLYHLVPNLSNVTVSVHCHNDLGVAVANSLAGLQAGCRQVECTINGIGERAGNASLEEIVMLLRTHKSSLGLDTSIDTREIAKTSRLVSRLTGYAVPSNKAIVGRNAFAHESGIHQDGVLKERLTYEIMDPKAIGLASNELVLGKHSGRHALQHALRELGHNVSGAALNTAFRRLKELSDKKKRITALDLEALLTDELRDETQGYTLVFYEVLASSVGEPLAKVEITTPGGKLVHGESSGDGGIDALFRAIGVATGLKAHLRRFHIDAVSEGPDALGEVSIVIDVGERTGSGQGVATDILGAAAQSYLRALTNATSSVTA